MENDDIWATEWAGEATPSHPDASDAILGQANDNGATTQGSEGLPSGDQDLDFDDIWGESRIISETQNQPMPQYTDFPEAAAAAAAVALDNDHENQRDEGLQNIVNNSLDMTPQAQPAENRDFPNQRSSISSIEVTLEEIETNSMDITPQVQPTENGDFGHQRGSVSSIEGSLKADENNSMDMTPQVQPTENGDIANQRDSISSIEISLKADENNAIDTTPQEQPTNGNFTNQRGKTLSSMESSSLRADANHSTNMTRLPTINGDFANPRDSISSIEASLKALEPARGYQLNRFSPAKEISSTDYTGQQQESMQTSYPLNSESAQPPAGNDVIEPFASNPLS
jgi:hypothetical protein